VRNSGCAPNFANVATCLIGVAQFGQVRSCDVSRAGRFISSRDYADRTRAASIQLDFTGLSCAEFKSGMRATS
jgi:hypothetical protein